MWDSCQQIPELFQVFTRNLSGLQRRTKHPTKLHLITKCGGNDLISPYMFLWWLSFSHWHMYHPSWIFVLHHGPPLRKHRVFSLNLPQPKESNTKLAKPSWTPSPPQKKKHILFVGFCLPPTPPQPEKKNSQQSQQTTNRFRLKTGIPKPIATFLAAKSDQHQSPESRAEYRFSGWLVSRLVGWFVWRSIFSSSKRAVPDAQWDWHIYLQIWPKFMVHVYI